MSTTLRDKNGNPIEDLNPLPIRGTISTPNGLQLDSTGQSAISDAQVNRGTKNDAAATSDTGAFSLIALYKRSLSRQMVPMYNAVLPTFATGSVVQPQFDAQGRQIVYLGTKISGEDDTNDVSKTVTKVVPSALYSRTYAAIAGAAILNAKAGAGNLMSAYVTNRNASARYLQVHNLQADPAANAVPARWFLIPGGTAAIPGTLMLGDDVLGPNGDYFGTGIRLAVSATATTYTAPTATEHDLVAYVV